MTQKGNMSPTGCSSSVTEVASAAAIVGIPASKIVDTSLILGTILSCEESMALIFYNSSVQYFLQNECQQIFNL